MEIDLPYREMEASPRPIFDAIVVLGSGVTAKTDRTEPGYDGKMRVIAACEALSRGLANNVLFTGGKVYGESLPSEAERRLERCGIDNKQIPCQEGYKAGKQSGS